MLRLGRVGRRAAEWGWRGCGEGWGVLGEVAQARTLGQKCAHKSCRREGPSRKASKRRIVLQRKPARRDPYEEEAPSNVEQFQLKYGPAKQAVTRSNCASSDQPEPYRGPQISNKFQTDFTKEKSEREDTFATEKIKRTDIEKPVIFLDHEIQTINYQLRNKSWLPKGSARQVPVFSYSKPKSKYPVVKTPPVYTKAKLSTAYQPEIEPKISTQDLLRDKAILKADWWRPSFNHKDVNKRFSRNKKFSSSSITTKKSPCAYCGSKKSSQAKIPKGNEPASKFVDSEFIPILSVPINLSEKKKSSQKNPLDIVRKVSSISDFITETLSKRNFTRDWLVNKFYTPKVLIADSVNAKIIPKQDEPKQSIVTDFCQDNNPVFSLDTTTIENDQIISTSITATVPKMMTAGEVNSKIVQLNKTLQDIRKRLEDWKISTADSMPKKEETTEETKESSNKSPETPNSETKNMSGKSDDNNMEANQNKVRDKVADKIANTISLRDYQLPNTNIPNTFQNDNYKTQYKGYVEYKPRASFANNNKENKSTDTMMTDTTRRKFAAYKKYQIKSATMSMSKIELLNVNHSKMLAKVKKFPSAVSFEEAKSHTFHSGSPRHSPTRNRNKILSKPKKSFMNDFDIFDLTCPESPLQTMKEKLRNMGMQPHLSKFGSHLLRQRSSIEQMRWLSTSMFCKDKACPDSSLNSLGGYQHSGDRDKERKERVLQSILAEKASQVDPDEQDRLQKQSKALVTESTQTEIEKETCTSETLVAQPKACATARTQTSPPASTTSSTPSPRPQSKWVVWKPKVNLDATEEEEEISEINLSDRLKSVDNEVRETRERMKRIRENLRKEMEEERKKSCVDVSDVGIGLSGIGSVVSPNKEENALRGHCFQETISRLQAKRKVPTNREMLSSRYSRNDGYRSRRLEGKQSVGDVEDTFLRNKAYGRRSYSTNQDIQIHTYDSKDETLTEKPALKSELVSQPVKHKTQAEVSQNEGQENKVVHGSRGPQFDKLHTKLHRNSLTDINKLETGRDPRKTSPMKVRTKPEMLMRPKFTEGDNLEIGNIANSDPREGRFPHLRKLSPLGPKSWSPRRESPDPVRKNKMTYSDGSQQGDKNEKEHRWQDNKAPLQRNTQEYSFGKRSHERKVGAGMISFEKTKGEKTYDVELNDVTWKKRGWTQHSRSIDRKPSSNSITEEDRQYKEIANNFNMNKGERQNVSFSTTLSGINSKDQSRKKYVKVIGKYEPTQQTVAARPITALKRDENEYPLRQFNLKTADRMRPRFEPDSHIVKVEMEEKPEIKPPPKEKEEEEEEDIKGLSFCEKRFHMKEKKKIHDEVCKTILAMKNEGKQRMMMAKETFSPVKQHDNIIKQCTSSALNETSQAATNQESVNYYKDLSNLVEEHITNENFTQVETTELEEQTGASNEKEALNEINDDSEHVTTLHFQNEEPMTISEGDEAAYLKEDENHRIAALDDSDGELILIERNDLTSECWDMPVVSPCLEEETVYFQASDDLNSSKKVNEMSDSINTKSQPLENIEKIVALKNATTKKENEGFTKKLLNSLKRDSEKVMEQERPRYNDGEKDGKERVFSTLEEKMTREINELENERKFEELREKLASGGGGGAVVSKGSWTARVPDGALPDGDIRPEIPPESASTPDGPGTPRDLPRYRLNTPTTSSNKSKE